VIPDTILIGAADGVPTRVERVRNFFDLFANDIRGEECVDTVLEA
jgi:hypothetical protein